MTIRYYKSYMSSSIINWALSITQAHHEFRVVSAGLYHPNLEEGSSLNRQVTVTRPSIPSTLLPHTAQESLQHHQDGRESHQHEKHGLFAVETVLAIVELAIRLVATPVRVVVDEIIVLVHLLNSDHGCDEGECGHAAEQDEYGEPEEPCRGDAGLGVTEAA